MSNEATRKLESAPPSKSSNETYAVPNNANISCSEFELMAKPKRICILEDPLKQMTPNLKTYVN